MVGRACSPFHFHYAPWFGTTILAHMLDSLVRVSRRAGANHFASIKESVGTPQQWLSPAKHCVQSADRLQPEQGRPSLTKTSALTAAAQITWSGEPLSTAERADAGLRKEEVHRPETAKPSKRNTGSIRFPPNNFKHFLTLFSKFFASFPHGTCSLSVSRLYLALDEIYHPFWAAISNNPTRQRIDAIPDERKSRTGFSPSVMPCSKRLIPAPLMNDTSIDYNSGWEPCGF